VNRQKEPVPCPRCQSTDTIWLEEQSIGTDSWYCFKCRSGFPVRLGPLRDDKDRRIRKT